MIDENDLNALRAGFYKGLLDGIFNVVAFVLVWSIDGGALAMFGTVVYRIVVLMRGG